MVIARILPKPQQPIPADPLLFSTAPPGIPYLLPTQAAFYTRRAPREQIEVSYLRRQYGSRNGLFGGAAGTDRGMRKLGEPAVCPVAILRIRRLQIFLELCNSLVGVAVC